MNLVGAGGKVNICHVMTSFKVNFKVEIKIHYIIPACLQTIALNMKTEYLVHLYASGDELLNLSVSRLNFVRPTIIFLKVVDSLIEISSLYLSLHLQGS